MLNADIFSINGLKHHRAWVAWSFVAALLLRLFILSLDFPGNDAVYYYDDGKIALNLVAGNGYSISYEYRNWLFYESLLKTAKLENPITEGTKTTAIKQPAYPLLLAGLFYLFGTKNFLLVFVIHAIVSSATVSLLFLCLRQIAPFSALAVALGATIYPAFAFHSVTAPESTTLLLFLVATLWFWLIKIRDADSWRMAIIGGAIGGVALLTEPVTLFFLGLSFCYGAYLNHHTVRNQMAGVVIASAVALLVTSPWLVRNYVVFDRFPVFKSGVGHVFAWGLHFSGKGSWIPEERMVMLEKAGRNLTEMEEEDAMAMELRSAFPNRWREYLTYDIPHNFIHFWWDIRDYWNNYSFSYVAGRRIPYVLLLVLAVPQLFGTTARLIRQPRAVLSNAPLEVSALMLIATYTVVYSLFGAFHSRYRLPVEMGLFIFAGATLRPIVESVWNCWAPLSLKDA